MKHETATYKNSSAIRALLDNHHATFTKRCEHKRARASARRDIEDGLQEVALIASEQSALDDMYAECEKNFQYYEMICKMEAEEMEEERRWDEQERYYADWSYSFDELDF